MLFPSDHPGRHDSWRESLRFFNPRLGPDITSSSEGPRPKVNLFTLQRGFQHSKRGKFPFIPCFHRLSSSMRSIRSIANILSKPALFLACRLGFLLPLYTRFLIMPALFHFRHRPVLGNGTLKATQRIINGFIFTNSRISHEFSLPPKRAVPCT